MRLYTEEQVMRSLELAYANFTSLQGIIDRLTPIELPSDEEIQIEINCDVHIQSDTDFFNGAKWMRDKLTSGNNERKWNPIRLGR